MSRLADRRRRGRPTPAGPMVLDELDEFDACGEDELLDVLVNYHRSALGAWTATLAPEGSEPVTVQASSAHDALHKALDLLEALSLYADVAIATVHTLDGDAIAWAMLAAREGFGDCAITDPTLAELITHH